MNNKRILIVGFLAIIVTMMVGYALFSENITINGTATAKGDFALKTTCMNAEENTSFQENTGNYNTGVSDSIISCNDTVVTSSVSLNMPGAENYFLIEVENTGSIPFRLKSIQDLDTNKVYYVDDIINEYGAIYKESDENFYFNTIFMFDDLYDDPAFAENGYVEPTYSMSWYQANDYNFTNKIIPGGKAVFYLHNYWGQADTTTSNKTLTLKTNLKLNFEQVTSN